MQPSTTLLALLTGLLATTALAAPAPATDDAGVPAPHEGEQLEDRAAAKLQSWQAAGGCASNWAKKCHAQCVGEGVQKHNCKVGSVSSGIESSHCFFGFNVCECHC